MVAIRGITKRWIWNSLVIILAILLAVVLCLVFVARSYYYNGIQQTMVGYVNSLSNIFDGYVGSASEFSAAAREYVENFPDRERMELMVFNSHGNIIITSTGFPPDMEETMPDYERSLAENSNYGLWDGRLSTGERVMAVTKALYGSKGNFTGAIRYVVSLEEADHKVRITALVLSLTGLLVISFVILSSSYFIRSIVNPIREIGVTAKRIAQGDFNARIDKVYDDEIGELCDTINNMAGELGTADRMKNDFISSVSHELRTPLTAIKGWAETMQQVDDADRSTMEKGMGVIVREAERLSGIVEELLDFSRLQSGRMVLIMDKIDILAELGEAVYMFRERALSEKKYLLYDEPEMVSPVLGDKNRLRQVFVNIIDNALKYTSADGTISVNVAETDGMLHIIISDNGCGISPEHMPRIKEKFYKANQTQRGSGIGLAVADEIMNLHSGSLFIESTEGVGTTVTLSIPAETSKKEGTEEAG